MPLNTRLSVRLRPLASATAALALLATGSAWAQNFPITPGQRSTAEQVAQAGVPLSELAPNAPDSYTIKRGDTLWAISRIFLRSPWRWPELWGMNLQDIRNPHLIFPGQVLYLLRENGRARLSTSAPGAATDNQGTIRVSPRTRYESLADSSIPPVNLQAIEAFLTEPLIVDEATFARAPRIVATPENRVLLTKGDRAYARGQYSEGAPGEALVDAAGKPRDFRVFRNAVPLKDPTTGETLGFEAQYVGKALLERSELRQDVKGADGKTRVEIVPATIDIVAAKEEMRVGDRLLPEPPRDFSSYVPSAPTSPQSGQIVSVYGNAVTFAAQNQVVAINRGTAHGLQRGHVLALVLNSNVLPDKTDSARPMMRLPGERNGLMMVFRTFDKVSYALVLEITDGAKVGDRFTNP
ncbi:MAG: LysM peptidoglycan-binding domain-containing protein [Hydrogenophaga sp.]|jgi:nucleoid-associated protein YgaU|nr:LysM peptidoglycan-binding domain-containing protein [Hydrogenophaga sp.]